MREEKDIPKYCSKCGEKLDGNSKFCPECGNKLLKKKILIKNTEDFTLTAERSKKETNSHNQQLQKTSSGKLTNSTKKQMIIGGAALIIFIMFLIIVTNQPQQHSIYIPQQKIPLDWYFIPNPSCSGGTDYYYLKEQYTYTFDVDDYASIWKIKIQCAEPDAMNVEIYYGDGIDSNHLYDTITTSYTSYEKEYDNEFGFTGHSSFTIFNQGCYVDITLLQYTDFGNLHYVCGPYRYYGT